MHHYHRLLIQALFIFSFYLSAQTLTVAKLLPQHDPRTGILESSLVVLVKPHIKDWFQIEQVFLGDQKPGELLHLPNLKMTTLKRDGTEEAVQITLDTRILLYLQHKSDEPGSWEVTYFGQCYFYVVNPEKSEELKKIAKDAVALRREWEAARNTSDEKQRVEALWQYLFNNDYRFRKQTKAELKKIGVIAGDYIAEHFQRLAPLERIAMVKDLGEYGSQKAHRVLLAYLKRLQEIYDFYLAKNSEGTNDIQDNLGYTPKLLSNIPGELFFGVDGLISFRDWSDLPYIRELAQWAILHDLEKLYDAASMAFGNMPDKNNLPTIEAILKEYAHHQWRENGLPDSPIIEALKAHPYPQAVPMLVQFLENQMLQEEVRKQLTKIAGKDLGNEPEAWLTWYKIHKSTEANK